MFVDNLKYIKKILVFDELASTNDYALSLEKAGEPSGTLIRALKQSQGRGRQKRPWFMKEGDVAMSLILRTPNLPHNYFPLMPWIFALACVEALKEFSLDARLKWPNDIVIKSPSGLNNNYCGGYEKVGGVLVENIFKEQKVAASILGLGLNIIANPMLKKEIPHMSWLRHVRPSLSANLLWPVLLKKIDENINNILSPQGNLDAHRRYLAHCVSIGRHVKVVVGDQQISGQAMRLNPDGFLVVFDGQKEHIIYAGEINF